MENLYTTKSVRETVEVAKELGNLILSRKGIRQKPVILCLYGELGSGKTVFVQGLAQSLGITSRLLSPTFIIVRRYQNPKYHNFFYHIDLYRINGTKSLHTLGILEILTDPDAVIAIEWADKLGDLLPITRTDIRFAVNEDGSHRIQIKEEGIES